MQIVSLALRSWLRYVVPLTVLAVIPFIPVWFFAMRVTTPVDAAAAKSTVLVGYGLVAIAWVCQLVVVGAVAPAVRAVAAGETPPQLAILARGVHGIVGAIVPSIVVAAAVFAGSLALVVPGLVVLGLLAPTGASREIGKPLPRPLVDALAVTRKAMPMAIAIGVALLVIDAAIPIVLHRLMVVPVQPKNPPHDALEHVRLFVRATAGALAIVSPLIAAHVAAVYEINRAKAPPEAPPHPAPP